jgi:hypothetical protein
VYTFAHSSLSLYICKPLEQLGVFASRFKYYLQPS